jgi:cell division initiation protein
LITGMEIRNQQFGRSLRGYNEEEVKSFLLKLGQDYETIYSENSQLKESIQRLKYELERYRKMEEAMNNSLILAQQTGEMLKANAQKEASMMLEDSKRVIAEMLTSYQEVVKRLNLFNLELKSQLGGELEMLEKNQKKTEELSTFFYNQDVKDLLANLSKLKLEEKA